MGSTSSYLSCSTCCPMMQASIMPMTTGNSQRFRVYVTAQDLQMHNYKIMPSSLSLITATRLSP